MLNNLTVHNVNHAVRLLPKFNGLVKNNIRFRVAVGRWKKSINANDVDKYIEMRIAMEALFIPKKSKGSTTDRLAIHSAKYLISNIYHREGFYQLIKNFYDIASLIVHGTHPSKLKFPFGEFSIVQEQFRIAALQMISDEDIPDWNKLILQ